MDFQAAASRLSGWTGGDRNLRFLFLYDGGGGALTSHLDTFSGSVLWDMPSAPIAAITQVSFTGGLLLASFPSKDNAMAMLKDAEFQSDLNANCQELMLIAMPSPSGDDVATPIVTGVMSSVLTLLRRLGVISSSEKLCARADGTTIADGFPADWHAKTGARKEVPEAICRDIDRSKEPIYMLNMVRFKSKEHEKIYKGPDYGQPTALLFMKMGGKIAWKADVGLQTLIDTRGFGDFHEAFLIQYPSLRMFAEFVSSDAYMSMNDVRVQAMDGGLLHWTPFQPLPQPAAHKKPPFLPSVFRVVVYLLSASLGIRCLHVVFHWILKRVVSDDGEL